MDNQTPPNPSSPSLREKVARIVDPYADWDLSGDGSHVEYMQRSTALAKADDIFAAMREPTEAMERALAKRYSYHNAGDEPYDGEARDYWQAMIDAALAPELPELADRLAGGEATDG